MRARSPSARSSSSPCSFMSSKRFDAKPTESVADGGASRTTGVAGAVEPAIGDLDQFDRTPRPLLDELVAHAGQGGDRLGGQSRALVEDLIGQPLIVEAPRLDRRLRRHA